MLLIPHETVQNNPTLGRKTPRRIVHNEGIKLLHKARRSSPSVAFVELIPMNEGKCERIILCSLPAHPVGCSS